MLMCIYIYINLYQSCQKLGISSNLLQYAIVLGWFSPPVPPILESDPQDRTLQAWPCQTGTPRSSGTNPDLGWHFFVLGHVLS